MAQTQGRISDFGSPTCASEFNGQQSWFDEPADFPCSRYLQNRPAKTG